MTDQEPQRKKGGRPRKHSPEAKRPTMAFRMSEKLHQSLIDASQSNERSLSEEIERRLEQSFELDKSLNYQSHNTHNLLKIISIACAVIENRRDSEGNVLGSTNWKSHHPTAAAVSLFLRHMANEISETVPAHGLLSASTEDPSTAPIHQAESTASMLARLLTGKEELPRGSFGSLY